jgi:hypothetical protein
MLSYRGGIGPRDPVTSRRVMDCTLDQVPLPGAFFDRPADQVARDLLGQMLVRRIGRQWRSLIVTETEAYIGPQDLASPAARGRALRAEPKFGRAGTLYIYLGHPAAVLIRSAGGIRGPGRLVAYAGPYWSRRKLRFVLVARERREAANE